MSETQTAEPTESAPVSDASVETTPEVQTEASSDQVAEPVETQSEPEQPKPRRADRHVANLTARLSAKEAEVAAAERRAAAAEAMLQAAREGNGTGQPNQPRPAFPTDVEAQAEALVRQRDFERRLTDIDTAGKKEAGNEVWTAAKDILTGLGATNNQAFLEALAETTNPAKIFAALADDSDEVVALLKKSPAAMAAHLGRLDAKMEATSTPRASSAPKPPAPMRTPAVQPEPDLYDEKLSMKEWAALWDKQAPRSLGGRR